MTTTTIMLPVKTITFEIVQSGATTSEGNFTLGFDNGYVIHNGKRLKIGRNQGGYEFIRQTINGKRKYLSAKMLLALYE